jgi:hypothetical protein
MSQSQENKLSIFKKEGLSHNISWNQGLKNNWILFWSVWEGEVERWDYSLWIGLRNYSLTAAPLGFDFITWHIGWGGR